LILLCYDGSEDAQAAVEHSASLFPHEPVTVLAVWEPYVEVFSQSGFGLAFAPPASDMQEIDTAIEDQARATAQDGADRLRQAGMAAEPRIERRQTSIVDTILAVAGKIDAKAIVLGTRGRGGVKSLLLGSVSHAVVQHADRPVVVIPSHALVTARAGGQL
jgi:nucleotide-binding universal stress UspA family protein